MAADAEDDDIILNITLTLGSNGYDAEGLLVGPEALIDYSFESSDKKVAF